VMDDLHFDNVRAVPRSDMRSFECVVGGVHQADGCIRCVRNMSCMRKLRVLDLTWAWTLGCFAALSEVLPRCVHLTHVAVGPARSDEGSGIKEGMTQLCTALRSHPTLRCLTVRFELSARRQAILKAICPVTEFL